MPVYQSPTTDSPPTVIGPAPDDLMLVQVLDGYRQEADTARKGGFNPRDLKWEEHLDLYWNRFDFSNKAPWQARAVLPEVPQFVERFAASMTEALAATDNFYTIVDPTDTEGDLARAIKRMMDVWLSQIGRSPQGHPVSFLGVFEDLMKLGALMSVAATVYWKEGESETDYGHVCIEPIDPRRVWLDHTGRGMYRIRRTTIDKHELLRMAGEKDDDGASIYKIDTIRDLVAGIEQEVQRENERLKGSGEEISSTRKPITLDEYLCTIVMEDGEVKGRNVLCVVANERWLIRGPEENPFWHQKDWVLAAPLVSVPLSVYGRSYMENFGSLARVFNDLTNLILDATFTTSMKAFAIVPEMLENPADAEGGVYPNVTFRLDGTSRPQDFMKELDLGALGPEPITVWRTLKDELREAASFNEIGMGQLAPNSRTSASEIVTSEQNSSALIRDLARNVEYHILEPILDLVWKTGLQHMQPDDPALIAAVQSEEMFQAIFQNREELAARAITFQCRGLSTMVAKQQRLRTLIQMLSVIGQNQMLAQAFLQKVAPEKLLDLLLDMADIDLTKLSLTPREKAMQAVTQLGQQAAPGQGSPAGAPQGAPPEQVQATVDRGQV